MAEDNKKSLTKKEVERAAAFEKRKQELQAEGYAIKYLNVEGTKANTISMIIGIPFIIVFFGIFKLMGNKLDFSFFQNGKTGFIFIISMALGIVIHEIIHGITFALFTKNGFKDVEFGFLLKSFNPYAYCRAPLKKHQYLIALLMPFIILGIIPSIIALIKTSFILLLYGVIMIVTAGGDLLIVYIVIKNKTAKAEKLYLDHPTEVGVVLFEK